MGFKNLPKEFFGNDYEKEKRNYELAVSREKLKFQRKYPSANLEDFIFDADLARNGDVVGTSVKYKKDRSLPNITGYIFKKYYEDTLYWQPRLWGPDGTVQKFVLNTNPLPYDVTKFKIFVNREQSFLSNFENLETSWKGTEKDITKVAVKKEDPYFASLLAACIISHVGRMSRTHLIESDETPKIITSIARYYVYYHTKRFLEDPRKMDSYITEDLRNLIKNNLQVRKFWKRKFARTRENISLWYSQHPNRRNIRNYRYVMSGNNTGVLGIEYEEIDHVVPKNEEKDWTTLIKENSDGLTFTIGRRILRLLRFRFASANEMAYHRKWCKKFTNSRHFPQVGERHNNARRSRESRFQYENGHKRHERCFKHGDNSGNNINTFRHDHFKGKSNGI